MHWSWCDECQKCTPCGEPHCLGVHSGGWVYCTEHKGYYLSMFSLRTWNRVLSGAVNGLTADEAGLVPGDMYRRKQP